jgi:hypothetical protein
MRYQVALLCAGVCLASGCVNRSDEAMTANRGQSPHIDEGNVPSVRYVRVSELPADGRPSTTAPSMEISVHTSAPNDELVGQSCRIALRRDALGLAAAGVAEPMAPAIGGKQVLLEGTIVDVGDDWIVLQGAQRWWVPTSSILMIEINPPADAKL